MSSDEVSDDIFVWAKNYKVPEKYVTTSLLWKIGFSYAVVIIVVVLAAYYWQKEEDISENEEDVVEEKEEEPKVELDA